MHRHEHQALLDQARAPVHSTDGQRDRRRRQPLAEGSFADATNNHGFKRARWRRLWRVQIQDWLIAGIQNIKILLRAMRRHTAAAQAVLGASKGLIFGGPVAHRFVLGLP